MRDHLDKLAQTATDAVIDGKGRYDTAAAVKEMENLLEKDPTLAKAARHRTAVALIEQEDKRRRRLLEQNLVAVGSGTQLSFISGDRAVLEAALPLGEGLRVQLGKANRADLYAYAGVLTENHANQTAGYAAKMLGIAEATKKMTDETTLVEDIFG